MRLVVATLGLLVLAAPACRVCRGLEPEAQIDVEVQGGAADKLEVTLLAPSHPALTRTFSSTSSASFRFSFGEWREVTELTVRAVAHRGAAVVGSAEQRFGVSRDGCNHLTLVVAGGDGGPGALDKGPLPGQLTPRALGQIGREVSAKEPRIASDGSGYLLVWLYAFWMDARYYGLFLDASGAPFGQAFEAVSCGRADCRPPALAYSPSLGYALLTQTAGAIKLSFIKPGADKPWRTVDLGAKPRSTLGLACRPVESGECLALWLSEGSDQLEGAAVGLAAAQPIPPIPGGSGIWGTPHDPVLAATEERYLLVWAAGPVVVAHHLTAAGTTWPAIRALLLPTAGRNDVQPAAAGDAAGRFFVLANKASALTLAEVVSDGTTLKLVDMWSGKSSGSRAPRLATSQGRVFGAYLDGAGVPALASFMVDAGEGQASEATISPNAAEPTLAAGAKGSAVVVWRHESPPKVTNVLMGAILEVAP